MIHDQRICDQRICERARQARDPRFDGLFFIGVLSTGIYCRPICPAPAAKPENIVYFPTAAAAAQAGLRPCLRCRPEVSPGSPAWNGTSATVSRAMLLIRQGALNEGNLEGLARKLGVGSRHLRRLFQAHLGASPKALATTEKVLFAKQLLNETTLSITQIAFASGFGSVRRFNAAFKKCCGQTPSAFRRPTLTPGHNRAPQFQCTLNLTYRPPFDWERLLRFFEARGIPGVEVVADGSYHRTIRINNAVGRIAVAHAKKNRALRLTVSLPDSRDLMCVVQRVRSMFDLDANMAAIHDVLAADPLLETIIHRKPGLRLPGAWDPFEVAVRAIVGQQVSVKGARTVIGRIVAKAGPAFDRADRSGNQAGSPSGLTHLFPTARELWACELGRGGMPGARLKTLKTLSQAVMQGDLSLSVGRSQDEFIKRLTDLPGIGRWTANYIAMRALGEPDAFPASDLGIIKALCRGDRRPTEKQVLARAENWRPWRAYAAIYLWHS